MMTQNTARTVLVAEANDELAQVLRSYLCRQGFKVEIASGGLDCIAKYRRFAPDVLVLDLDLPWGNGDGVIAYLREEGFFPLPAVILTACNPAPEAICALIGPPVVRCLQKPFSLATLLDSIHLAVDWIGLRAVTAASVA